MTTVALDKIKFHKEKSEVHKQAEEQELVVSSKVQPDWNQTRQQQFSKHEQCVHNLMLSCIYLCQNDISLNNIESLCSLLEKLQVNMLPAEVAGVNYRNDTAALCFVEHIAAYLHEEVVNKLKNSPALGTVS